MAIPPPPWPRELLQKQVAVACAVIVSPKSTDADAHRAVASAVGPLLSLLRALNRVRGDTAREEAHRQHALEVVWGLRDALLQTNTERAYASYPPDSTFYVDARAALADVTTIPRRVFDVDDPADVEVEVGRWQSVLAAIWGEMRMIDPSTAVPDVWNEQMMEISRALDALRLLDELWADVTDMAFFPDGYPALPVLLTLLCATEDDVVDDESNDWN